MSKNDYHMRLCRISSLAPPERPTEKRYDEMTDGDRLACSSAAGHRLAELMTARLYDRVPRSAWMWVR